MSTLNEDQIKEFWQKYQANISIESSPFNCVVNITMPYDAFERLIKKDTSCIDVSSFKTDARDAVVVRASTDEFTLAELQEMYDRIASAFGRNDVLFVPADVDLLSMSAERLKDIRKRIDDMIAWSDYDYVAEQAKNT